MKALIFDLDGTLIDSVYPHTLSWQQTLNEIDMPVPAYAIHRYIGISGKLLVKALSRARGRAFDREAIERLEQRHDALFRELGALQQPLPGAVQLLEFLRQAKIPHGIATTGKRPEISGALRALGVDSTTIVIDGSHISDAKPEPDLFLECQEELGIPKSECTVLGDAIWDVHAARRAGISSVGLLTGGLSAQELFNAGAMRVYRDPHEVLLSLDELGLEVP
jgi:HAD superfamily hydrolase (TIGR01549 family)